MCRLAVEQVATMADELFALDVEESLLRLRPRLPSGALPSLTTVAVLITAPQC